MKLYVARDRATPAENDGTLALQDKQSRRYRTVFWPSAEAAEQWICRHFHGFHAQNLAEDLIFDVFELNFAEPPSVKTAIDTAKQVWVIVRDADNGVIVDYDGFTRRFAGRAEAASWAEERKIGACRVLCIDNPHVDYTLEM